MIKKLALIIALALPLTAHADSEYAGIWKTPDDVYLSIHQAANEIVVVVLNRDSWEALTGYVVGPQAVVNTVYGGGHIQLLLHPLPNGRIKIVQVMCVPLVSGYVCPSLDEVVIKKIF